MIKKIILLGLLVIPLSQCLYSQEEDRDYLAALLPDDQEISGFSSTGAASYYFGDEMYSYINGGADIYIEYGVTGVVSAYYSNVKGKNIHIEVYLMENSDAAFGIFSTSKVDNGKPVDIDSEGVIYKTYLDVWKDRGFIRISFTGTEGISDNTILIDFGKSIAERIKTKANLPEIISITENNKSGLFQRTDRS